METTTKILTKEELFFCYEQAKKYKETKFSGA